MQNAKAYKFCETVVAAGDGQLVVVVTSGATPPHQHSWNLAAR
jgi:hypothetical protein